MCARRPPPRRPRIGTASSPPPHPAPASSWRPRSAGVLRVFPALDCAVVFDQPTDDERNVAAKRKRSRPQATDCADATWRDSVGRSQTGPRRRSKQASTRRDHQQRWGKWHRRAARARSRDGRSTQLKHRCRTSLPGAVGRNDKRPETRLQCASRTGPIGCCRASRSPGRPGLRHVRVAFCGSLVRWN